MVIAGDLSVRTYMDRNGLERTSVQITAEKVDFGSARKNASTRSMEETSDELPI